MSDRFDESAATYRDDVERAIAFAGGDLEPFTEAKVDNLLSLIRRRIDDPRNVRALDVGCGVGITDSLLGQHLSELHGVDVSRGAICAARARNPTVSYRVYSGSRLPYDDQTFDLTFAICVLHHLPNSYQPAFLSELARVTKPSGLVVTVEHNPINPLTRIVVSRCAFDDDAVLLTRRRNLALFRLVGLTPVESPYILFFPRRSKWVPRIERRLTKLPLGAQYLVAARPSGSST